MESCGKMKEMVSIVVEVKLHLDLSSCVLLKHEEILRRELKKMDRMVHQRAVINDCSAKKKIVYKHPSSHPEQSGQPLKVAMVNWKTEQVNQKSKNLDIKIDANPTFIQEHPK
eukprot:15367197-Ditylum_brightwellii.AAC.2